MPADIIQPPSGGTGTEASPAISATTGLPASRISSLASAPYLLGSWGGERTRLSNEGITFNLAYAGEMAHNFTGGDQHLTRYADQWTLGMNVDMQKRFKVKGGEFQITFTDRNGSNLSMDAGLNTLMQVQQIYGRGQTWRLTQLWWNQTFGQQKQYQLKAGRVTVGEDFADFSCDFQNLTFCGSQPGNIVGDYWYNWPVSQWGGRFLATPSSRWYMQLGVYQYNPAYISNTWAEKDGWKPDNPSGTQGTLIPAEFAWKPVIRGQSGTYKFGGWYNTAAGSDLLYNTDGGYLGLSGGTPLMHNRRYGGYVNFQQQLTGSSSNGLSGFFNTSLADHQTSATNLQVIAGVEKTAPFRRPYDSIGFALGATNANTRQALYQQQYNQTHPQSPVGVNGQAEYATELFYNWAVIRSVSLRPNLQYVLHPGGNPHNPNVFVFGLQTYVTF